MYLNVDEIDSALVNLVAVSHNAPGRTMRRYIVSMARALVYSG